MDGAVDDTSLRLQWGRDLLIAEIKIRPVSLLSFLLLQWGRDLLIAEIYSETMCCFTIQSFNGAAIC